MTTGRNEQSILVVDDSSALRAAFSDILKRKGWQVTLCPDGPSAIRSAVAREYAVALIEFSVPGIRGAVVAETIRMLNPQACIIGMSFHDRKKEFLTAGADAFLLKPFDLEAVISTRERKDTGAI